MDNGRSTQLTVWAVISAVLLTALAIFSPIRFAYRNHDLHLVLETVEALVALLAAFLVFGRFRRGGLRRDLLVSYALGLLGGINLLSVGFAVGQSGGDHVTAWSALVLRLVGASAFACAAFTSVRQAPDRASGHSRGGTRDVLLLVGAACATVLAVFGLFTAARDVLPDPVSVRLSAAASAHVIVEGHAALLLVQGLSVALYAGAAFGFTMAGRREEDDLLLWFGAGAIFSTAARVSYLLFPSLYSDYVYFGDLLRLAFYVLLLIGAAREIRLYWEQVAAGAAYEARRSLARDLHDGVAQELVFIAAQSKRLERGNEPDLARGLSKLSSASERAVGEARRAIRALVDSSEESLAEAVTEVAGDMTRGSGLALTLELGEAVDVSPAMREGLLRIMSEALRNAVRHSEATAVTVTVSGGEAVSLVVADNGQGFATEASRNDGFGLVTMTEQAEALGGKLSLRSEPGRGTRVEVRLDG